MSLVQLLEPKWIFIILQAITLSMEAILQGSRTEHL